MALTLNETAIDYRDPKFDKMLSNLQGNILKGHGRNHTTHIFIKFKREAGYKVLPKKK
jgi:deferrochelatase/peroxidase EfeB